MSDKFECLLLVMINVDEAVFSITVQVNWSNDVSLER